jgi:hypothetical protein
LNVLTVEGAIKAHGSESPVQLDLHRYMDGREHWVQDIEGSNIDRELCDIGESLDLSDGVFIEDMLEIGELVDVLAFVRSSRAYWLLKLMINGSPDLGERVAAYIEHLDLARERGRATGKDGVTAEENVFFSRLVLANQFGFLSKLFSKENVREVMEVLGDEY